MTDEEIGKLTPEAAVDAADFQQSGIRDYLNFLALNNEAHPVIVRFYQHIMMLISLRCKPLSTDEINGIQLSSPEVVEFINSQNVKTKEDKGITLSQSELNEAIKKKVLKNMFDLFLRKKSITPILTQDKFERDLILNTFGQGSDLRLSKMDNNQLRALDANILAELSVIEEN